MPAASCSRRPLASAAVVVSSCRVHRPRAPALPRRVSGCGAAPAAVVSTRAGAKTAAVPERWAAMRRRFVREGEAASEANAGEGEEDEDAKVAAMPLFLAPFGFGYGMYGGGLGFLPTLIFIGAAAYFASNLLGDTSWNRDDWEERDEERIAVARVQVGLLGQARELQRELDAIAGKADTESRKGLHTVLVEAALALLRNPQYLAYAYADTVSARTPSLAEGRFNEYSLEERSKFEGETLSNVGGVARAGQVRGGVEDENANTEYILVTILLAYDGAFKLPKISNQADALEALQTLGRTQASRVNAVEVIWSPQVEGDTLTAAELIEKFPKLIPL